MRAPEPVVRLAPGRGLVKVVSIASSSGLAFIQGLVCCNATAACRAMLPLGIPYADAGMRTASTSQPAEPIIPAHDIMHLPRYLGIARSLGLYYGVPFRMARMRALYAGLVPAGGLCFDIGAHVGNRLRCFRAMGARVVALEPQPDFARILRLLYGRDPAVTILEAAVGAEAGEARLLASVRTPTVTTLNPHWVARVGNTLGFEHVDWSAGPSVQVTTLDALVGRHGMPDFVKIDVEGHESSVLAGLSQALPTLSFEYLPAARDLAVDCIDRLAALGDYHYNWSVGETSRFGSPEWVRPQAARDWIGSLAPDAGSGDLYARLAERAAAPLPAHKPKG